MDSSCFPENKAMAICCGSVRDDSGPRTKSALSHMLRTPVRPWCLSINQVPRNYYESHPAGLALPFRSRPEFGDVQHAKEKDHPSATSDQIANFWDLHRRLAESLNGTGFTSFYPQWDWTLWLLVDGKQASCPRVTQICVSVTLPMGSSIVQMNLLDLKSRGIPTIDFSVHISVETWVNGLIVETTSVCDP